MPGKGHSLLLVISVSHRGQKEFSVASEPVCAVVSRNKYGISLFESIVSRAALKLDKAVKNKYGLETAAVGSQMAASVEIKLMHREEITGHKLLHIVFSEKQVRRQCRRLR